MDGLYREFGARVRSSRKSAGLTQQQVAERVGLTRTSITNIERGRQHIALHQLYLLASAVGVPAVDLLPDHDATPEELLPKRALKVLEQDTEGRDFATRVLRKSQQAEPQQEAAAK